MENSKWTPKAPKGNGYYFARPKGGKHACVIWVSDFTGKTLYHGFGVKPKEDMDNFMFMGPIETPAPLGVGELAAEKSTLPTYSLHATRIMETFDDRIVVRTIGLTSVEMGALSGDEIARIAALRGNARYEAIAALKGGD